MRILHVNERAGFYGGVERILQDLAAGLADLGHPQALLYGEPTAEPRFLAPFADSAPFPAGSETLLRRFRPDAVLIHKLEDPDAVARLAASWPTVRMIHDHDLACLRRHKYFPLGTRVCQQPAGISCWTHLCVVQRGIPGSPLPLRIVPVRSRRQAIRAHRQVGRFVVGSRWMRDELAANGIPPERVDILPPVPRALGETRALPPSGTSLVLYVGQVIRGKGVDLLLRALAGVREPWQAKVVGTGNHLDECRALADRLGIGARVDFAGWIDHEGLEALYAQAAVCAVPSRWPEPFGMVGIEAMARGRPVVGFAVGGIPDWLEDGVTGLLAPEADPSALALRIERLLADPALARRLGEQGAERVAERYRPERFLQDMLAILERGAQGRIE